jgi:hypothetical protein
MVWYADIIILSGFVVMCNVYKIIKQLFHACSGNSQNYCPSVLEMTWELLPLASGVNVFLIIVILYSYFMPVQGTVKTIDPRCWR